MPTLPKPSAPEPSTIPQNIIPKTNTMNILLWNTEGLKSLLTKAPDKFTDNFRILMLTETFLSNSLDIPKFIGYHSLATTQERGRPIGGVSIYISPQLLPATVLHQNDNLILLETNALCLITAYFNPNTDICTITYQLAEAITQCNKSKAIIVGGDFNCRIDKPNARTASLLDTMNIYGFILNNDPTQPTYIAHNGTSTIDLIFTKFIQGNVTYAKPTLTTPLRKHQPMQCHIQLKPHINDNSTEKTKGLPRKINTELLQSNQSEIQIKVTDLITLKDIDEATRCLTDVIINSIDNKQHNNKFPNSKKWFDKECQTLNRIVQNLLNKSRKNQELLTEYSGARKHYHNLCRRKQEEYDKKEEIRRIEEAEKTPYTFLKRKSVATQSHIDFHQWNTYLTNLYFHQNIRFEQDIEKFKRTQTNETLNQPFKEEEILNCIMKSKNGKATGPDQIANEHLKQSAPALIPLWTKLFNGILEYNTIPKKWRTSNLTMLYKGKGSKEDPSSYRAIATSQTPLKILNNVLVKRITTHVNHLLPDQQYGFRHKKSTQDAVQMLLTEIDTIGKGEAMYVAFIDFKRAFDTLNRPLLIKKLVDQFNITGPILELITNMLRYNILQVTDGNYMSNLQITQTVGVPQGSPSSPLWFILMIADIVKPITLTGCGIIKFADDIAIHSKDKTNLQAALYSLEEWTKNNQMEVNVQKTKIIKFRKGGKLSRNDKFLYGGEVVEIVNNFTYLGVTVTTTGRSFTQHIKQRSSLAISAIHTIPNIKNLSLATSIQLFHLKISPVIEYCLPALWSKLSTSNFETLDTVQTTFLKHICGVPTNTRNRLMYLLCDTPPLCMTLKNKFQLPETPAYQIYLHRTQEKMQSVPQDFYETPAFTQEIWRKSNQRERHIVTRYSAHGYHHHICLNTNFHTAEDDCVCKMCKEKAGQYHLLKCANNHRPLRYYAYLKE